MMPAASIRAWKGHSERYSNQTHVSRTDPDARLYRKGSSQGAKLSYLVHDVIDTKSRVVIVRRPEEKTTKQKKALEAFFASLVSFSAEELLAEYRSRWSIEILIREAKEHYGLGQDRCRKYERIVGINGLRMLLGACQVLWFAREVKQQDDGSVALRPYQPWYEQKKKPSLHDIAWAVRERLMAEGITPTVGIWQGMGVIHRLRSEHHADQVPRAA